MENMKIVLEGIIMTIVIKKCNEHYLGEPYICDPKTGECEKCEPLYYGKQCENEAEIAHCKEVNKTGTYIKCEDTFYLLKG